MAFTQNVNIRRNWERCPRTQGPVARWTILYATMTPDGDITISAHTHRTLGEPDSYVLLFDRERSVIGLQPARSAIEKDAYPARDRGKHGGKRIPGHTLCREFGIALPHSVRFHKCLIDPQGVLILDLNETVPCGKSRPKPKKDENIIDENGLRYRLDTNGNKWRTY
jgi:hypothetical protein